MSNWRRAWIVVGISFVAGMFIGQPEVPAWAVFPSLLVLGGLTTWAVRE